MRIVSRMPFRQRIDLLCAGAKMMPPSDRRALSKSLNRFGIVSSPHADIAVLGPRGISPLWLTTIKQKDHPDTTEKPGHGLLSPRLLPPGETFKEETVLNEALLRAVDAFNNDPASGSNIKFKEGKLFLSLPDGRIILRHPIPGVLFSSEFTSGQRSNNGVFVDIENFLSDNPGNLQVMLCKARLLIKKGSVCPAETILRELLTKGFNDERVKSALSDALYIQGNTLFSSAHIDAAHAKYSEAFDIWPGNDAAKESMLTSASASGNADMIFGSLKLIAGKGFVKEAIDDLNEMISADERLSAKAAQHLFDLYIDLARDADGSKDYLSAIEFLNEAYKLKKDPQILLANAVYYYELGRWSRSYSFFKKAMERSYIPTAALGIFGTVCLKAGKHPREALKLFERALKRVPDYTDAVRGKGIALLSLGLLEQAAASLSLIADTDAAASEFLSTAKKIERMTELSAKADDLDLDLLSPAEIHILEAFVSLNRKKFLLFGDAFYLFREKCFRKILEKKPKDLLAMQRLAVLLERQGRIEEAEFFVREVLNHAPDNTDIFGILIELLKRTGRIKEARSLMDKEIVRRPTADIFTISGLHERDHGDLDTAISHFLKAVELDENDHFARIKAARLLISKNTDAGYDAAMRLCIEGKALAPGLFQYDRSIASIHMKRKEYEKALQVQLDLHRRMSAVMGKGRETRTQLQWLELRIADTYRDLNSPEFSRSWFNMAAYPPINDPHFLETAMNIEQWLKSKEKDRNEARHLKL